jgi:hypothetical protein
MKPAALPAFLVIALAGQALAQPFVAPGDIVAGWSTNSATTTIQLFDSDGNVKPDSWDAFAFIQSVEFDNFGGIPHNPMGNLVGVNFGTTAVGFSLFAYNSGDGWQGSAMFNSGTAPAWSTYGLTISRGGGLSVSPNNTKLAVTGNDTGELYIFEYDAVNRAITGGVQTNSFPPLLVTGVTSGSAWLDDSTVVLLSASGQLTTVDATMLTATPRLILPGAGLGQSQFTALAYRPEVSPYLYANYSNHDTPTAITTNNVYAVDPRTTPWTLVAGPIDMSASANTMREIALGDDGALYFSTHGNSSNFPRIQKIVGVTNPQSIQPNSSQVVVVGTISSSFNGIDVAGGLATPACYANCDGSTTPPVLNVADFTCFLSKFAAGDPYANCDGSTTPPVLNVADFTCFLSKFAAGCP